VAVTHAAFQIMVAAGLTMLVIGLTGIWFLVRGIAPWSRPWFLTTLVWASPLGFIAVEAGWTVTEVGRQPWIANGMLRTAEAVTPMPGLVWPLILYIGLYALLGVVVATLLRYHVMESPSTAELADATRAGAPSAALAELVEGRHAIV
jgi:cytochrome d ubiquinol oxidase subunit I